jgi:hypothetical protein
MRLPNAAIWVWLLAASGCIHQVRPEPKPVASAAEPLPLRAKYYLAPGEASRVYSDRFFALGIVHSWNVEIGHALDDSFPKMLRGVFASVRPANGPGDIDDADVFITPVITRFDTDGGSFISTFKLRLMVLGADRKVVFEEELTAVPGEDESGLAWGGVFTGVLTLQTSAERAFELMLGQAAVRLHQALDRSRTVNPVGV